MFFLKKNKNIIKEIISNKLENIKTIEYIEEKLSRRRVKFNIRKNDNVILLLSGGLDSVINWGILLDEFKANVYPLFLNRNQKKLKNELKSIKFYSKFYRLRYKKNFKEPVIFYTPIPPKEIRFKILRFSDHKIRKNSKQWLGIPLYSQIMIGYAIQYAYYLKLIKKIKINIIVFSFVKTDGEVMKYETLTSVRLLNYLANELTNEKWFITSLPIEKNMGFYFSKKDLILWAQTKKIPLQNTWSCNKNMLIKIHCGKCIYCSVRKKYFNEAKKISGIKDETLYLDEIKKKFINKFFILKKLFKK